MFKVVITGGSGLVGKMLCKLLISKGYSVSLISRTKKSNSLYDVYSWSELDFALQNANYIIHLAGAGIVDKPWTTERKKEIVDSRVETANKIFNIVQEKKYPIEAFISASAIGYYGMITSDKIFLEEDEYANDFLGNTCKLWEDAATKFSSLGIRSVKLRTGIVLSKEGGALHKIAKPIQFNIGAALGSGKQFLPWIHIEDLCNMYLHAIENETLNGAYNAVASEHIDNNKFTKLVAHYLNKLLWLPNIPAFLLKIILGKRANLLLEGSRISNEKILKTNFQFKYPTINLCFENLFQK